MRAWLFFAALLGLALIAGLAAGTRNAESPIPSVDNPGPRGAKVLRAYLERTGHTALVQRDATVPAEAKVRVLIAPEGHALSKPEVDELRAFVEGGGTLVYLVPRDGGQPDLDEWLNVKRSRQPPPFGEGATVDDPTGLTAVVTLHAGPLTNLKRFRVQADRGLETAEDDEQLVPLASHGALWWKRVGEGDVFLGAGPDLAQNRRLELEDNLAFWVQLAARGPVSFDEFHQAPRPTPPLSVNLWAVAGQLVLLGVLVVWSRGARLGPARPTPQVVHRSSLEYVTAMANLTQAAGVENELAAELRQQLRQRLSDQHGIAVTLPAAEVSRLLGLPDFEALDARLARGARSPGEYAELVRQVAAVEAFHPERSPEGA